MRGGHSVSVDSANSGVCALNTGFGPLGVGGAIIELVQPAGFDVPSNVNTSILATITGP